MVVMLFASERIPKGREIIVDYGPDYWQVALPSILNGTKPPPPPRVHAPASRTPSRSRKERRRIRDRVPRAQLQEEGVIVGSGGGDEPQKILGKRGR